MLIQYAYNLIAPTTNLASYIYNLSLLLDVAELQIFKFCFVNSN